MLFAKNSPTKVLESLFIFLEPQPWIGPKVIFEFPKTKLVQILSIIMKIDPRIRIEQHYLIHVKIW
jgi:hypothetical protein